MQVFEMRHQYKFIVILFILILSINGVLGYTITTNGTLRKVTTFSDNITVIIVNGTGAKWLSVASYPAFTSLRISLNSRQGILVTPEKINKAVGWDYTYSGGVLNITYPGTHYLEPLDDFIIFNPNPQSGNINSGFYGIAHVKSDAPQIYLDYNNFNWINYGADYADASQLSILNTNGIHTIFLIRSQDHYLTSDIRKKNFTYFKNNNT